MIQASAGQETVLREHVALGFCVGDRRGIANAFREHFQKTKNITMPDIENCSIPAGSRENPSMTIRIVAELYSDPAHSRLTVTAPSGLDKTGYPEIRPAARVPDPESVIHGHLTRRVAGPRNVSPKRHDRHVADAENGLMKRAGKFREILTWDDALRTADKRVGIPA
jgi:hypothetical protein